MNCYILLKAVHFYRHLNLPAIEVAQNEPKRQQLTRRFAAGPPMAGYPEFMPH